MCTSCAVAGSSRRARRNRAICRGRRARRTGCATCCAVALRWPLLRSPGPTAVLLAERFELRGRIGAGGLAEVFAARDRATGAEVAVKLLHAHLVQDQSTRERFRRKLSIARSLEHPGIVRVFDLHSHQGRPFISMELLRGRTLHQRLLQDGPLPPEEARRIAQAICSALRAAHREGVIHRDLKPQNVFLTQAGTVKVLDSASRGWQVSPGSPRRTPSRGPRATSRRRCWRARLETPAQTCTRSGPSGSRCSAAAAGRIAARRRSRAATPRGCSARSSPTRSFASSMPDSSCARWAGPPCRLLLRRRCRSRPATTTSWCTTSSGPALPCGPSIASWSAWGRERRSAGSGGCSARARRCW